MRRIGRESTTQWRNTKHMSNPAQKYMAIVMDRGKLGQHFSEEKVIPRRCAHAERSDDRKNAGLDICFVFRHLAFTARYVIEKMNLKSTRRASGFPPISHSNFCAK
ncbi:hypothetical protein PRIPAC_76659, partial [Pristionchus pacificus]|uniref:Uncharacterized protein n=1 Tax=Pristionchus pacificus TaxID=54126 RepID=A0A2A6CAN3_PRIPA